MATKQTIAFNASSIAQSVKQATQAITVEVAPQPAKANVLREGFQVPAVALNNQAADFFLENLEVLQPRQTPRVVSQSIKPGVRVTAGTVVDLVLAKSSDIPFQIFDGVHTGLRAQPLDSLLNGMLAEPTVRQTVLKYNKAEDVSATDRALLTQQFQRSAQISIDDSSPDTSFNAAFEAARVALAFK
jgi:beta-lactam-binding protein with PASTA domain